MSKLMQQILAMLQILTDWATDAQTVITTKKVDIFYQSCLGIQSRLQLIKNLSNLLGTNGVAADKAKIKSNLCQIAIAIVQPVKSFAISTKNNTLLNAINNSYSSLFTLSTEKCISTTQGIHNTILPLVAQIKAAGYAIDNNMMQSMQSAIDAFVNVQNSPKQALNNQKAINLAIKENLYQAFTICQTMLDNNIISFMPISASYVTDFYIRRQVIYNSKFTRFIAQLVDELGQGIALQTITVDEYTDPKTGKKYAAKSATTDATGSAIVEQIAPGYRTVTLHGDNIQTQTTQPFKFELGKTIVAGKIVCKPTFNLPASKPAAKKQLVKK